MPHAIMSTQPPPSMRCLLSELPSRPVGDKVRFLGCVISYSSKTAILTLEHGFPSGSAHTALVDVHLVLQSLGNEHVSFGAWVHVIGYISSEGNTTPSSGRRSHTRIQAVLLWVANGLDLPAYENALVGKGST